MNLRSRIVFALTTSSIILAGCGAPGAAKDEQLSNEVPPLGVLPELPESVTAVPSSEPPPPPSPEPPPAQVPAPEPPAPVTVTKEAPTPSPPEAPPPPPPAPPEESPDGPEIRIELPPELKPYL